MFAVPWFFSLAVFEYFLYAPQELGPLLTLKEKELVPEGQTGKSRKVFMTWVSPDMGSAPPERGIIKSRGL